MEDDPFMSLALCAEEPSAECATAIAPKPDMEDDPLLKLADQEAKIGSLNESWAKSAPQPAPGVRRKPTVGAIPLSNPSVLPTLSAGFQIKAFRGREPPPPVDKPTSRAYQDLGQGSLIQRHSGLKVKNPLVSHSQLEARLANRSVVSLKDIRSRHHGIGLGPSWATICAVGEISDTREASSGNLYSIWKLTDLKDTSVSLFLFGRAHSDLTGEVQPGSVVAILSAKVREGRELDLSVDNADQVLVLGTASEFGYCKAKNHNGEPCRVPVNLSSCDYCARHVMKEYNRLRTHRIELQGNALKSAFQPGMQRTLKWKPGHFAPYQAQPKPTLPPTTQTQMKEMAAKAAGRGSTAGSRYVTTVADPAKARAAVADVEQQRLRVNKLAKNAAPIPLARTSKVVYEAPHSGKAQTLKRGRDADRSGSGSGRAVERDSQAPKRGPAATVGSGGSGSGGGALVALEEDDIFVDPGDRAAGGAGGSCLAGGSALARQRAVEVLEGARSESKSAGIPANVPEFLAVPLRLQREKEQEEQRRKEQQKQQQRKEVERQQQRRQATRAAQHITAAAASSRFRVGHAAIAQPAVSINPRPNAPARPVTKPGTKAKPNGKGSAPASGFAAAFGRVIREMEAQQDVSGDTGSLYRDLVEGEDAERLNHVLDTLEKKDAMANKMDSIKSLEVSAWKCNECGTTTEYRPRSCHAAHPRALHRVQGVKRWWQCSGCSKRFATVGVKYPKGRCPKCNEPGTEFTAVSMLRPTRTLEHEAQQGGVAGPDQLLTRGIEQPWVNQ